jgi:hypothetical protein
MNERIRELATQADLFHTLPNGNLYPTAMTAEQSIAAYQKFAQLIVEECAGVGYDASYYECALNVSNKIKEHFGVEE